MAQLCSAAYAAALVLEDGSVQVFGSLDVELGLGQAHALPALSPVSLGNSFEGECSVAVKALSAVIGECHGLLLSDEGRVFTWGQGSCGALGQGHFEDLAHPTSVLGGGLASEVVVMASPGYSHVVALTRRGQVFVWGTSFNGELGTGPMQETHAEPVLLNRFGSKRVEIVGCGCAHSLAVDTDGCIWGWGENGSGQLGLGDRLARSEPTLVEGQLASQCHSVVFIACSTRNSGAITNNNKLWLWGDGQYSKLPDSDDKLEPARICDPELDCVLAVACHEYFIVALSKSREGRGFLKVWGGVIEATSGSDRAPKGLLPAPLPLGVGDRYGRRSPTRIAGALQVKSKAKLSMKNQEKGH